MTPHTTIAIVDQTKKQDPVYLNKLAAALQTQVVRDLAQFWPVSATVTVHPDTKVPHAIWPVYLKETLPAGEGGYHWVTGSKQPYSVITVADPNWSVDVSHEICEMLIDPWGNRLQSAPELVLNGHELIENAGSDVDYLVESCDPCESVTYRIGGIEVSDFLTPAYWQAGTENARYSYSNKVITPLELLPGGYISYLAGNGHMMQWLWLDPNHPPQQLDLGPADAALSLREFSDGHARLAKAAKTP